jgi:beta-lactamase regulating signal transducer with metallopeptidase domain
MSLPFGFHGIAPEAVEGMIYSLIEGSLLAFLIGLALRLIPRKNSGTRFIVWFSTLLAVTLLPFLGSPSRGAAAGSSAAGLSSGLGLFTLPASWAGYVFLAWAVIAMAGLARVAVGLWQVLRLRRNCTPVDTKSLGPEAQEIVARFQQFRSVQVCISTTVDVPTAVGFLNPAILLPSWLVAEVSPIELKHILLHELAHLRRYDDWTNLVQKIVKAVMFFHPLVWWIEGRLSLEREVACDDAVLVQTDSPRTYAQCLARVAEKSFLRRQIALAQAAVSRLHQLSSRVAQILDIDRPKTTRLWKPAIPLVALSAVLCGFSMRQAPVLVGFAEERSSGPIATTAAAESANPATKLTLASNITHPVVAKGAGAQVINAEFKLEREQHRSAPPPVVQHRQLHPGVERSQTAHPPTMLLAGYSGYVVAHEEFVVTMTNQGVAQGHWQVQVWQLRVLVPASHRETVTPRKT